MAEVRKAVVLLSGGIDSAVTLLMAREDGFDTYALSFHYGQRHIIELQAASDIALRFRCPRHETIRLDSDVFGGSALTRCKLLPKDRSIDETNYCIPVTYVPARNTIFLSYALAWAESLGAEAIFIGCNADDYAGYPDCRPEYLEAFQGMMRLATKEADHGIAPITLKYPLIGSAKAEIIRCGQARGLDFSLTVSCYDATLSRRACGRCDACIVREKGFAAAGIDDPVKAIL